MSQRIRAAHVKTKRAYDPPAPDDGVRVLVDRLWPRGLSKERAAIDLWLRDAAPSDALRAWFDHTPSRWLAFRRRYAAELRERREDLDDLRDMAGEGPVTLVYAARDEAHNNAIALRNILLGR